MADMNRKQQLEIENLVNRLCDDLLSKDELDRLDQLLHDHTWAIDIYIKQVQLHARLAWCSGYPSLDDIAQSDSTLYKEFSLLSKIANECDSKDVPSDGHLAVRAIQRGTQRLLALVTSSTWSMAASLAIIAALFGSGKIWFSNDSHPSPHPIVSTAQSPNAVQATLTRSSGVQWGGPTLNPKLGSQPGTHLMKVLSGRLQMTFDNGVEVVVEGPAEFSHDGFGGMTLSYGTLTAVVPTRVAQFSVYTSSAFVDCSANSEFGLIVDENGQTELHVLRGSASAEMLSDAEIIVIERAPQAIRSGQAVRIDREEGRVTPIVCDLKRFERISIHCLDVVDLLSGGNGYSEHLIYGIHTLSGKPILPRQEPLGYLRSDATYHPVEWNRYIDGVSVPCSPGEPVQIDSDGHTYRDFPSVSGETWGGGILLHRTGHEQPLSKDWDGVYNWLQSRGPDDFAGITGAFLGLHANCCLSLDLRQIREIVPEGQLHHLHAELLHVRSAGPRKKLPAARPPMLWVFLDGELHASYRPSAPSKPVDIDVPFLPGQHFLTLVVTDGDGNITEDWMVLANPILNWLARSPDFL